MSIKSDKWIRRMAKETDMINPFVDGQVRNSEAGKVISYGTSSYGYDVRCANEFKIFTNINSVIVDPKNFDPNSFVDVQSDVCIIPPNSFALARTVEYFKIPRDVLVICLGKCLTADTRLVDAETGAYKSITEFSWGQQTLSLNNWQLETAKISAFIPQGRKPVFKVKTRSGLTIRATANHPFKQLNGWTALEDLKVGNRIAVTRNIPVFGKTTLPDWEATLLGLMISEGTCRTPNKSPMFTTGDLVLAQLLKDTVAQSGLGTVTSSDNINYRLVNKAGRGGIAEKNRTYSWLSNYGLATTAEHKFVPQAIFTAPKDNVRLFLQALFSGDGGIYKNKKNNSFFLEYYSKSRRLIEDVHHLLQRFGIVSLMREKTTAIGTPAHKIQITDREQIINFYEQIGFYVGSIKQLRLENEIMPLLREQATRLKSNFDTLPPEAWLMLNKVAANHDISLNSLGVKAYYKQSLSYRDLNKVINATQDEELMALNNGVLWDVISSIEADGEEDVFDLTIPKTHNFVANGFIVHNSTYARVGIIVNVTPLEPCFSSDTEILTKNGWKYFNEIVIGSEVLTMNPQTHEAQWQNVERIQAYTYRGDLLHFNSRGVDLLVTPDHSLYVDKFDVTTNEWQGWHKTKAENVFAQDDYRMSRHVNWQGTDIDDEIIIANTAYNTNSLLEFIGMYLTAGWCSHGKLMGKVINIKTTTSDDTDKLQSVLSDLGKSANYNGTAWQINCSELAEYLQEFGQHHHSTMPQWLKALPRYRLQLVLKGLKLNESKASIYTTVSARLADDIQEVIFKVGLAATLCNCSIAEVQKQANGHDSISQYTVFKIRQSIATDNLKLSPQTQKKVPYTGMVYDVTVPNHIIFVRRNGKAVWSGNCWEGHVTLEFSNTTPLPAKIYANEGVAQLLFFGGDEECETSYKDREGKYQGQTGITLPKA